MSGVAQDLVRPVAIALGVVAAAAAVWWLIGDRVKGAAAAVGTAVNPTSDRNLAYRGVNAVGGAVTGKKDFALGSWIYDLFHEDAQLASDRRAREIFDERRQLENQGG